MRAEPDATFFLDDAPHPHSFGAPDIYATVARGSITPPRLVAIGSQAAGTRPAAAPRLTIADLRLPIDLVRDRADALTHTARARGAPHSLRLWRAAFEEAILALAREATGTAASASCEALFWQQSGDEYCVSVTFGQAPRPLLH